MERNHIIYIILIILGLSFIGVMIYLIAKSASKSTNCPVDCGLNKKCNTSTYTCECEDGYIGDDCSLGVTDISISNFSSNGEIPHTLTPSFDPNISQYTISGPQNVQIWKINVKSKNNITVSVCDPCSPDAWVLPPKISSGQGTGDVTLINDFNFTYNFHLPIKISSGTESKTYVITKLT